MGTVRAMRVVAMDDNLVGDGLAGWRICQWGSIGELKKVCVWLGLNLRRVMERCGEMERQSGGAELKGGVNKSSVYFIPPPSELAAAASATWSIRSQSRKIISVREVIVRSLHMSSLHDDPRCTVRRSGPAVVFALGGLTSNYWRAFSDVLVPLFTTARAFAGEVELVVTAAQPLFIAKYLRVLAALSRYEVVDADGGEVVLCYPHLIVGLRGHRDFDPARAPNGYDMVDACDVRWWERARIPWGKMEPYAEGFFGAPAAHMGIRHVAYSVAAEESTPPPPPGTRCGGRQVYRAKLALDGLGLVELIAP
ncbi:hypothetical protein HU200_041448 [Digitaria exilis]|uniref:Uncharacterized protein n=1 Tax=Digitaria exilis TaxID=1010633 RepID=A0A835B7A5_9POAL|nr:hypothetical protein HU200_041448 [Digitaria exilis]